MIEPHSPEEAAAQPETHESFLQIAPLKPMKFKPNSNYIRLDYTKAEKVGEIYMPQSAKGLKWVVSVALECGPDCKLVKPGDSVILAYRGLVNAEHGDGIVKIGSQETAWTQENMIIAVLDHATE